MDVATATLFARYRAWADRLTYESVAALAGLIRDVERYREHGLHRTRMWFDDVRSHRCLSELRSDRAIGVGGGYVAIDRTCG
jgi:uncharacterized protein YhjY with autotransporter beta-barrel domain